GLVHAVHPIAAPAELNVQLAGTVTALAADGMSLCKKGVGSRFRGRLPLVLPRTGNGSRPLFCSIVIERVRNGVHLVAVAEQTLELGRPFKLLHERKPRRQIPDARLGVPAQR